MKSVNAVENKFCVLASHSIEFATAHFYRQPLWSNQKNETEFGPCTRPYGHGHNYKLHAAFRVLDPKKKFSETSPVETLTQQMNVVLKTAVADFDHHHISFEHPVFSGPNALVPTTENIALYLWQRLNEILRGNQSSQPSSNVGRPAAFDLLGISLHEDATVSAEIGISKRRLFDQVTQKNRDDVGTPTFVPFSSRTSLATGESFQIEILSGLPAIGNLDQNSYVSENAESSGSLAELSLKMYDGSNAVLMTNRSGHFFFAGFLPTGASFEASEAASFN